MEGRHGEYSQSAHCQLGGARGEGQEAFGVGQLSSLQAGQVAPESEQIHVKVLQVLLPQKDLQSERDTTAHPVSCSSRHFVVLISNQDGASSLFPRSSINTSTTVLPTCAEWFGV